MVKGQHCKNFINFTALKNTRRDMHKTRKPFSPTGNIKKPHLSQPKTFQKITLKGGPSKILLENIKKFKGHPLETEKISTQRRSGASQHMTKTSISLICVNIILIACVYIQQFNFVQ